MSDLVIRPSSLPALAQCPQWLPAPTTENAAMGEARHAALVRLLQGEPGALEELAAEDAEGVEWAFSYIQTKAPASDFPLRIEEQASFFGPGFQQIWGTPDVVCGPEIFDLKWRERDYGAQMAAYALMVMRNPEHEFETVRTHLLFGHRRHARVLEWQWQTAWALVEGIIEAVDRGDPARPCDYCSWCARRFTCPALMERAMAITKGYREWELEEWHSSVIDDPVEMGKALRLARHVEEWCKSVEFHAREMAIKKGQVPQGFALKTRQGNRFIANIADAFAKAGIPQDLFLATCEVRWSALVEACAMQTQSKKAATERDLEKRLGENLQRKPSSQYLAEEK